MATFTPTDQLLDIVMRYDMRPCATCGRYRLSQDLLWNLDMSRAWCSVACRLAVFCAHCGERIANPHAEVVDRGLETLCAGCRARQDVARSMVE